MYYRRRNSMGDIEILSVVAVLEDVRGEGLVRGQVGTVVESWAPGVYEVEFCDEQGKAYAMVALKEEQLMRLYHQPLTPGCLISRLSQRLKPSCSPLL
jgi:hypothetical protein